MVDKRKKFGSARRNIKVKINETTQEVDLEEILKRKPRPAEREAFVQKAIEKIANRTTSGKSLNGRDFKIYSEKYADKKGTSRSNVDLKLTGSMIRGLKRLSGQSSKVKFGIKGGVNSKKSFNHNVGDTLPKREWFGLQKKEINQIAKEIRKDDLRGKKVGEVREEFQKKLINKLESQDS